MKIKLVFILIAAFAIDLRAQRIFATVEGTKAIIGYQPGNGESFAGISRKFNTNDAEIYSLNADRLSKSSGQPGNIKVPVNAVLQVARDIDCFEIWYIVQPHEGLFRIGQYFGNIKAVDIKKLNNLRSDALKPGQELLMGYLPKKLWQAETSSENSNSRTTVSTERKDTSAALVADTLPVIESGNPNIGVKKPATVPVEKDSLQALLTYEGTGFFRDHYVPGTINTTKLSAVFKSESGWADGKYYVLINEAATGKVVRLSNPVSGKIIYAKVAGPLPVINKKDNVVLRISSASAAALGITGQELFVVDITY